MYYGKNVSVQHIHIEYISFQLSDPNATMTTILMLVSNNATAGDSAHQATINLIIMNVVDTSRTPVVRMNKIRS